MEVGSGQPVRRDVSLDQSQTGRERQARSNPRRNVDKNKKIVDKIIPRWQDCDFAASVYEIVFGVGEYFARSGSTLPDPSSAT
jgi:5-hydroxyisourate hydrolase-like protein (transthyretin family)